MLRRRLALAAAALVAATAAPAAAAPLPGTGDAASVLFTVDAARGTLVHRAGAERGRLVLTLHGVERRATWFADRPVRAAGGLGSARLFGAWDRYGFGDEPPNAALVLERAPAHRDTIAIELRLRGYDPRTRTARFAVRTLAGLGRGLDWLERRLDERLAQRFGAATLFIDNASMYEGCALGQPQLMASPAWPLVAMTPADGRLLPLDDNMGLASLIGDGFGGDLRTTIGLPDLAPPAAGTRWFVCTSGRFPSPDDLGTCETGEVDFWTDERFRLASRADDRRWMPADGRSVRASDQPLYAHLAKAKAADRIALPDVPAPRGMKALVCVRGEFGNTPAIGQLDLFAVPPLEDRDWTPADGRLLQTREVSALDLLMHGYPGTRDPAFAVPNVPAPAPGVRYYLATGGVWPGAQG